MTRRLGLALAALGLLNGCIGALPPPAATAPDVAGERLLAEAFVTADDWLTYRFEGGYAGGEAGVLRLQAALPRYVFSTHNTRYTDTIIEAEAYVTSSYTRGLYGVMCRANAQGQGYYFVISANGNFSIRRLNRRQDTALVAWQGTPAIQQSTRRNVLRVVCRADRLALYINGQFVAEATDTLYHAGYVGVAAALPNDAPADALMDVVFQRVTVWDAP